MQNSTAIENFNGYSIDGHIRVQESGVIMILERCDKGRQVSSIYNPTEHKKLFGHYVKLPIINRKGKKRKLEVDVCDLYEKAFPNKSLPSSLSGFKHLGSALKRQSNSFEQLSLI